MSVDNPLKWLLTALPGYIEPEALAVLLDRYEANKRAYERQLKINKIERVIKTIQQRNDSRDAAKLARWKVKLDKLKKEEST